MNSSSVSMGTAPESGRGAPTRRHAVLVCMPMAPVEIPSLALGLLKAILVRDRIPTRVVNGHLHYLTEIGARDFLLARSFAPQHLLVDWVFAAAAFDTAATAEDFAAALVDNYPSIAAAGDLSWLVPLLRRLRGSADRFLDWMLDLALRDRPAILGCTSTFQQHAASLALLRRAKLRAPDTITVMGGANLETVLGIATHARFPWVDVVVSGEADDIVAPLFRTLLDSGAGLRAEDAPYGVLVPAHRATGYPEGPTPDGKPRRSVTTLRDLPAPDYDEYFDELFFSPYRAWITPALPVEFSRGCWWGAVSHCTFCGLNGGAMDYRVREAGEAAGLLQQLSGRYGIRRFEVVDNILSMDYFKTFLVDPAVIAADYALFCETKSNLRESHVAALARAGVRFIQPGIESLHSAILKLMRKGVTAAQNILLLRLCRQYGVRASWSIIVGFPGEEDAWYAEASTLLPRLAHLQVGAFSRLRIDRYSPYFRDPARFGLRLRPAAMYEHVFPTRGAALEDHAYFFDMQGAAPTTSASLRLPQRGRGLERFREGMKQWAQAWAHGTPPVLTARTIDGEIWVTDTRPAFATVPYHLSAAEVAFLRAAAPGLGRSALRRQMETQGMDEAFETTLNRLDARGLVVELDGLVLSLVLWEPVPPLPGQRELAIGYFGRPGDPPAPAPSAAASVAVAGTAV